MTKRFRSVLMLCGVTGAALLTGCVTEYPEHRRLDQPGTAMGATAADRKALPVAERDRVLVDYRTAATALRRGDDGIAKEKLDDAIAFIGGIITNSEQAARARSMFTAESTKTFIGEPYERVMAY